MLTWACYETKLAKFPLLLCPQHDGRESAKATFTQYSMTRSAMSGNTGGCRCCARHRFRGYLSKVCRGRRSTRRVPVDSCMAARRSS
jgi:hypothetical protein